MVGGKSAQYQQDHHQAKKTNKISVITAGARMLELCKLLAQSLRVRVFSCKKLDVPLFCNADQGATKTKHFGTR